jgi:UDP-glucose 6-dehydrogenase
MVLLPSRRGMCDMYAAEVDAVLPARALCFGGGCFPKDLFLSFISFKNTNKKCYVVSFKNTNSIAGKTSLRLISMFQFKQTMLYI